METYICTQLKRIIPHAKAVQKQKLYIQQIQAANKHKSYIKDPHFYKNSEKPKTTKKKKNSYYIKPKGNVLHDQIQRQIEIN